MAMGAGGLGGGFPGGSCGATGCSGRACIGPWKVLALGTKKQVVGVLVQSGTGAGCFPFNTGGVGSKLACMAGLAGQLDTWSFWMAMVTVVSALSNNSSTWVVSSSIRVSGVSEALVPCIWIV